MTSFFYFGVEVEAIVEPHNKGQPVQSSTKDSAQLRLWYGKLAAALNNRKGAGQKRLLATAEPNFRKYRKRVNRHLQWWVTWDGSLTSPHWPTHPGVPLEVVSPKLQTNKKWEDDIDALWSAMRAVFHMPRRSSRCGSHVHVSPGRGHFHLRELQAIAFAVVWYDNEVQQILHRCRRDAGYCTRNKKHSRELRHRSMSSVASKINGVRDESSLVKVIQGWGKEDRATLWNFQNVTAKPSTSKPATGSVEFRGGRCLRGPVRTKRWIAFAIAFVILAIKEFPLPLRDSYTRPNMRDFWNRLKQAAAQQNLNQYLPATYTTMNDSTRPNIIDEDNNDSGDDQLDPSNNIFTPQSAFNSLVNSAASTDNEDN